MTTSGDPSLPSDETPRRSMPWPQRPGYQRGPVSREPLKPRYTEKLTKSPRYPTLAQAEQRRRDFWSKWPAYTGIALMVAAGIIAFKYGTGLFPAGAFVVGLITFAATCLYCGCRNRNRV